MQATKELQTKRKLRDSVKGTIASNEDAIALNEDAIALNEDAIALLRGNNAVLLNTLDGTVMTNVQRTPSSVL